MALRDFPGKYVLPAIRMVQQYNRRVAKQADVASIAHVSITIPNVVFISCLAIFAAAFYQAIRYVSINLLWKIVYQFCGS